MNMDYFFNNIKNGDVLGFHYKKWYYLIGKIIAFFSYKTNPNKKNLKQIEHVGMIFNLKRDGDNIFFSFGESIGHEGGNVVNNYILQKVGTNYIIDSRFRNKGIDVFYLPCKKALSFDENILVDKFWRKNEKYDVLDAALSVNWIQKFLHPFLKKRSRNSLDNFCSGQVNSCFFGLGYTDKDIAPSPAEIVNQSYIDKAKITKLCK